MHMPRAARTRPSRLVAVALAIGVISGCGGGITGPSAGGTSGATTPAGTPATRATASAAGPAIATPVDAPTVIDVPHEVVASETVSAAGATITAEGATLVVPAGAVAADTKVEVTRLDAPFQQNPYARDEPDAVSAIPVGTALDFGPTGVAFTTPVSVTLPYDPAALPDGYDQVAIAYYTGRRWVVLGGTVDAGAHTVTVSQEAFEGEIFTTIAVATVAGIVVNRGIKWWYGKEGVKNDPISDKRAATWVAPKDPAVDAAAKTTTIGGVPISDKAKFADYMKGKTDPSPLITVTGSDGTAHQPSYSQGTGSNWQTPGDYLTKGGMQGDCTDVTNAFVSIFRNLGYPAKAVFGYVGDKESPHVWGEVAIGGKPYLIDEEGHLQPLDAAMATLHLIRPEPGDPRASMWDENGQVPYRADWWDPTVINGSWAGTFTVTDITIDEAIAKEVEDQGCGIEVLEALKGKALPMTMEIKVDGSGKGTAKMLIDMSSLKGADGKPMKADPQTINVTYADPALTFHLDSSSGATSAMTGRLGAAEGGAATITGSMTVRGKGYSMKAVWAVTHQ